MVYWSLQQELVKPYLFSAPRWLGSRKPRQWVSLLGCRLQLTLTLLQVKLFRTTDPFKIIICQNIQSPIFLNGFFLIIYRTIPLVSNQGEMGSVYTI